MLTTLALGNCVLEHEADGRLLGLLDGTRDRDALTSELRLSPEAVDEALRRLAGYGLLLAT